MLAISTFLYAEGIATLWHILPLAFVGAFIGDNSGYYLGRLNGERVRHSKWVNKHHAKYARTERFIQKYGSFAVILGRLITPIRSFVPFVIGVSDMSKLRFTLFDLLACTIWTTGLALLVLGIDKAL